MGESTVPITCDMKEQKPFDFAWCETHDTTFALGERCKFYGREMWEVYAEEASEQRARAVRAEEALEELRADPQRPPALTCHEEVSRDHHAEPCAAGAVAFRFDPNFPGSNPYPVCPKHIREPMAPALFHPAYEARLLDHAPADPSSRS